MHSDVFQKAAEIAIRVGIYYYLLPAALRPGGQLANAWRPAGEIFAAMPAKTPWMVWSKACRAVRVFAIAARIASTSNGSCRSTS